MIHRSDIDRRRHPDDRRQHMRYSVKPDLFVVFRRSPRLTLWRSRKFYAASIIDISLKGLRAEYRAANMWPYDVDTLSVVTADKKEKIDGIPYKIISDRKIISVPNKGDIRRVGIQFVNLSDRHIGHLISLLQNITLGPIPYKHK